MARALVKTHFKPLTVILKDVKPAPTAGGTFTSGAWQTRDLNYVEGDQSFITLPVGFDDNIFDNNGGTPDVTKQRFTLEAGIYGIEVIAPSMQVDRNKIKLLNVTDGTDDLFGNNIYSTSSTPGASGLSIIKGELTIASPKTFEVQHRCDVTKATDGFGVTGVTGAAFDIYTQVKITKIG